MNTSKNKRYIETEKKIHLAFEKLLSSKSFDEITVIDICNEAGISRPSFYAHYEDINHMMNQIELEKSIPIKRMLISSEQLTVGSFESYFHYLKSNQSFYTAYLGTSGNENMRSDFMNAFIRTSRIFESDHIHYVMLFFMAGLKSMAYNWLTDGCRTPSHLLAQIAFNQYQSLLDSCCDPSLQR